MDGLRHRIGVYWGLREDPELQSRWEAGRPDWRTRVVGFALGIAVLAVVCALVVLAARALL